jgi:hypothetical protein
MKNNIKLVYKFHIFLLKGSSFYSKVVISEETLGFVGNTLLVVSKTFTKMVKVFIYGLYLQGKDHFYFI